MVPRMLMRTSSLSVLALSLAIASPARAETYRQHFPWPQVAVYVAALRALPTVGLKVRAQDAALYRINAHAGISAFAWSDDVSVAVADDGHGGSDLEFDGVSGQSALQVVGRGRSLKLFERLVAEISRQLQDTRP